MPVLIHIDDISDVQTTSTHEFSDISIRDEEIPLLRHRLVLSPGAEIEGVSADRVIGDILDQTAAPR